MNHQFSKTIILSVLAPAVIFSCGGLAAAQIVRTAGNVLEEMRLREFSTARLIYNEPQVTFLTRTENLGTVPLYPHGVIEVNDMRGRKVGSVTVNERRIPVYSMSEREYTTEWRHDGFAFGRYRALLSIVYGEDQQKTLSRTVSFWVVPIQPIAITLGSLVVAAFTMYMWMRFYIRKRLRKIGATQLRRADANLYGKRTRPLSRLSTVVFSIFAFCAIFLAFLFFMFA